MRSVYLGTSSFAARVLDALTGSDHRPVLVVTPPDRPRGRGRRVSRPPVAELAADRGIEVVQTASVNEPPVVEAIRAANPDVITTCAFGQLIGEELLSDWTILNVHPSLLPRWRGAAPIERAIMAGDERTGVSVMRVTAGLDSGPVALAEDVPIGPHDEYGGLAERLQEVGAGLLVSALDHFAAGALTVTEQDDALATYAAKIDPAERRLDPGRPAVELERVVRALTPHIGAYVQLAADARLGVLRAAAEPGSLPSGELSVDGDTIVFGCSEGVLRLLSVQPAGGRPMDTAAYLRGHGIPEPAV